MNHSKTALAIGVIVLASCSPMETTTSDTPSAGGGLGPLEPADIARGGRLYDDLFAELGIAEPSTDHPLWKTRLDLASNTRSGAATWRCKECHGWDYLGVRGAYGQGIHRTGFRGILNSHKPVDGIASMLKDQSLEVDGHGFGAIEGVTDEALRQVAAFVVHGTIDTTGSIGADGRFTGSATAGAMIFVSGLGTAKACADCHGEDGLEPPGSNDDFADFVGKIANENPQEFLHKVRFGQPGTKMPAYTAEGLTEAAAADLGAFAQQLPQSR